MIDSRSKLKRNKFLVKMKSQIEKASKKKYKIGVVTDFISISGAVFSIGTIIFSLTEFNKPYSRPDVLFVSGAFGLAASSVLACVSSIAKNNDRQTELLKLIVSSKGGFNGSI